MKTSKILQQWKRLILALTVVLIGGFSVSTQAATYRVASEYDSILSGQSGVLSNAVSFARYMVPSLPVGLNTLADKQKIRNSTLPMTGSIAIAQGRQRSDGVYIGHTAFVEEVSGSGTNAIITTLNTGLQVNGITGAHVIRAKGTAQELGILGYFHPANLSNMNLPKGCVDELTGGKKVSVRGWAFDPDATALALKIVVSIGGPAGSGERHELYAGALRSDVNAAYPGTGSYHGFSGTFTTNKKGVQSVYVYAQNVGKIQNGALLTLLGKEEVTIGEVELPDTTGPVISGVKVTGDGDKYTITCNVSDASGIQKVQFPTWTMRRGQDDLESPWPTGRVSGNTVSYTVYRRDHNDECGKYVTDIYCTDNKGNISTHKGVYYTFDSDHSWNSGKVTTAATTKKNGVKTYTCTVCGETKTGSIPKIKSVKLSQNSYIYNGITHKPKVKVYNSVGKIIPSSNYTLKYSKESKLPGKYFVQIIFKDAYSGKAKLTYRIRTAVVKGFEVSHVSEGIKLQWKANTKKISGYQIDYADNSKFKDASSIKLKGASRESYTIEGLDAGDVYYVRIRSYFTRKPSSLNGYSIWSGTQKIRIRE